MSDTSDWSDASYATEPRGRGRFLLLALVLVFVACVAALGYIGVTLVGKTFSFANEFAVHTVHEKSSPDAAFALVIDTYDEGALGGATKVVLKPTRGDVGRYTLYDNAWLPDSEVRWLDARTVSINGVLKTPFVAYGIATGSGSTDGTAKDRAGYARNSIALGERIVKLSGLSLVLPDGLPAQLLTRKSALQSRPFQRLVPDRRASWSIYSLQRRAAAPFAKLASAGMAIGSSANITVRWDPATRRIIVLTRIAGAHYGLIVERDVAAHNQQQARLAAEALWWELAVRRARLPW